MAKKSMVNREVKRAKLVKQYASKRASLKAVIADQSKPMEERFKATLKLAELPRNSSARLLSQAQALADHAARPGLVRPDPGHGQVELVREGGTCR